MRSALIAAAVLLSAATASAQPPATQSTTPPPAPPRSAPAARQPPVSSLSPAAFAAVLQRAGFTAEMQTEDGHAFLLAKADATPFQVFFSNCQAGGGCTDMEMYAGFTGAPRVAWERINGWNARTRFSRAFLDENRNPALQMDVSLLGGVSQDSLKTSLETWKSALGTFSLFLVARVPPVGGVAEPPAPLTLPKR